jgi:outer membrane protein OmpA-like peptidoglycan-associated protein
MRTPEGWSQPVNLGLGVNTAAHEIFPTYHKGDIYFATNTSDTWGGYDIRRAQGSTQWKTTIAEGAPINSAADDVCVLFLSDDKAILTSNRAGGMGGDDLFLLTREARPEELHDMTAELECAGQAMPGVELTVRNDAGEIVQIAPTDNLGKLDIRALRLNQTYTFQLNSTSTINLSECLLVMKDSKGNRLTEVRFNLKGMATLELLPFQFSEANPLAIKDESLLNLSFEGQLYEQTPGDIGRGEPITILNSKGEPVAIAYTNDSGKFRFTKLDPQLKYVMRLSEQTEARHAIITAKGNKIDIPVLNAEVNYTRIAAEDAITLVNEFNDTIQVSPEDLFVINRIYYAYNSARLTLESCRQLEQLAIILERNTEITLELRSHTDARGDADYNLRLSQQRAKSAIQYLVGKGLSDLRFQSQGLGESQPLNECTDGVSCSEPEYAINRRTEIRLKRSSGMAISNR